jgi:glutathione S-transferase
MNPNGQIPALADTFTDNKSIRIFESGSILLYLIEQYDQNHTISYPKGSREHYETLNWLFFQNAAIGPMQGQATHFVHDAPEKHNYGIERYVNETRRLYGILEKHLAGQKIQQSVHADGPWLVGDRCTFADIAHIGWVMRASWAKVDIADFPHLKDWEMRMVKKDGVQKGLHVPETFETEI